jgi:hypothetical protein
MRGYRVRLAQSVATIKSTCEHEERMRFECRFDVGPGGPTLSRRAKRRKVGQSARDTPSTGKRMTAPATLVGPAAFQASAYLW